MKYETPELTALTPAVSAIQGNPTKKLDQKFRDSHLMNEASAPGYADWE